MRQGQRFKARLNERPSGQIHCSLLLQQNGSLSTPPGSNLRACRPLISHVFRAARFNEAELDPRQQLTSEPSLLVTERAKIAFCHFVNRRPGTRN
jgi:hypothetical protein